jgi:predicted nucleic acid-binding protein
VRRVLVDTGPLVALCDERDALHPRALEELDRLSGVLLAVGLPALTEAHFLLAAPHLRARLASLFDRDVLRLELPTQADELVTRALSWLKKYAQHEPDFADAYLVAAAEHDPDASVWTFDREFSTVWRTLRGKRVRLSVR